jgi:hypothetical protein
VDFSETVATIPTNASALEAIEHSSYKNYSEADFAEVRITLTTIIELEGHEPKYTANISIEPAASSAEERVLAASHLPISVNIVTAGDKRRQISSHENLRPNWSATLLEQPLGYLAYKDVLLTVADEQSNFTFLSSVFSVLMPTKRSEIINYDGKTRSGSLR